MPVPTDHSIPSPVTRHHMLWPLLGLMIVTLLAQFTTLDIAVSNWLYDFDRRHWIADGSWWADTLVHDWGRNLIAILFLGATGIFALSFLFRKQLQPWRHAALYLLCSIALTTSLVGLGKNITNIDCPRDLQHYNGIQPYVHLFSDKPDNLPPGHCFPGGHSSGAFSLFALYFIFLALKPRRATIVLLGVIALGSIYALAQWARGAHFLSHDAWSAAIGWYTSIVLYRFIFQKLLGQQKTREAN